MSVFGIFCLLKDLITAMTFVTDEELRILRDAVNKAKSEGGSLLMPYCRENKDSHNIDATEKKSDRANEETASGVRATEEIASGSSPVPEASVVEQKRPIPTRSQYNPTSCVGGYKWESEVSALERCMIPVHTEQ